jgi:hypothetical protein
MLSWLRSITNFSELHVYQRFLPRLPKILWGS